MLKNLLSNAIKFTHQGNVTLRVGASAANDPGKERSSTGRWIVFSVVDTGIGVATEKQREVFEAFLQADGSTSRLYGGTGLGLTISRELARLLGGDIRLDSELGKGSTLTLRLPERVESEPTPVECPAGRSAAPVVSEDAGPTILVVEPDSAVAERLEDLVRSRGYQCVRAPTAQAGVELAVERSPLGAVVGPGCSEAEEARIAQCLRDDPRTRDIPVHAATRAPATGGPEAVDSVGVLYKPAQSDELAQALRRFEAVRHRPPQRVLVVDDDESIRVLLSRMLSRRGIDVCPCATSEDAVNRLTTEQFDCLILDIGLDGADGLDILVRVRERGCDCPPVVVYTGRELASKDLARLEAHAAGLVIKNEQSPEHLLDEISLFLHGMVTPSGIAASSSRRAHYDGAGRLNDRTVLLVDDDARNLFALGSILREHGMRVHEARDGREALQALDREGGEIRPGGHGHHDAGHGRP